MDDQSPIPAPDLLKNAAIKLILERGFSGATLTPILQEAGLSKGAMFHHFDSRDALMAAAYMQLLKETTEAEEAMAYRLRSGGTTLHAFLREMVERYRSEMFVVTMELAVAVRARPKILEAADGFAEWQDFRARYWQEIFELPGRDVDEIANHWDMLGYTMRGIGLRQMFGTDPTDADRLAQTLELEFFSGARLRRLPADGA